MNKLVTLVFFFLCFFSQAQDFNFDGLKEKIDNTSDEKLKVKLLDSLSGVMLDSNHPESQAYVNTTLKLAKKIDNDDVLVHMLHLALRHFEIGGKQIDSKPVIEDIVYYTENMNQIEGERNKAKMYYVKARSIYFTNK